MVSLMAAFFSLAGCIVQLCGGIFQRAGGGWLTFLWPPLATTLSGVILPLGAVAELLLMAWLVVKGVDASGWQMSTATLQL
jgi:hypothetical protein